MAHLSTPAGRPDDSSDFSTPVFATSVLGIGGIRFPLGGRK